MPSIGGDIIINGWFAFVQWMDGWAKNGPTSAGDHGPGVTITEKGSLEIATFCFVFYFY